MRHPLSLLAIVAAPGLTESQERDTASARQSVSPSGATVCAPACPRIQDNSFLVEEAYNQEAGAVQHIMTFQMRRGSSEFEAAFTQEWPIRSVRHQLSYDIPFARSGSSTGIGDIGVNYRYQLVGDGDAPLAVSPRLSLILPTGDWKRSRGSGSATLEGNIPASYVISRFVVAHFNIGASVTPSAHDEAGHTARVAEWSVGQSVIMTASSTIQPMLEVVYSRGTEVAGSDATSHTESFLVSPGFRAAVNFPSGLQIVPGIAFPIGLGPSRGERGVFVYLSFEHPF